MKAATPQALRQQYQARKVEVLATIGEGGTSTRGVHGVLRRLARLADDTLQTLWEQTGFGPRPTLVAVGGFGRGELYPASDIDVLLLLPAGWVVDGPGADEALRQRIETFISGCWDAGLEIGSSVRTIDECLAEAEKDVTVQTALLESRAICGNATLYRNFQRRFKAALDPQAFFVAKTLELEQRHNKFEDTPYALEPNCKESPGGLRDLQTILWVARAAGYGKSWDELARKGLATPFEVRQIKRNESMLALIRLRLHLTAGRREDRLVFDLQTAVAARFGYGLKPPTLGTGVSSQPSEGAVSPRGGPATKPDPAAEVKTKVRASEALMRHYYWAAKAVTQLRQILLLNIEAQLNPKTQAPVPINERFLDRGGLIEVADDRLYLNHPHAILETFLVYQTTPGLKGLSARTLRALYNARNLMTAKFRQDPVNRATFLQILQQPQGITHAMRLMNQTSVLGRYLWPFRRTVGQMQHDLFHVYTVDQHILMVLRNMRRFFMAEHAHEYPFCSQLAAAWDQPWILYAAALFHDIAKGRGGDHSDLGAEEVRRFAREHGIARDDAALIEFLVREHLSMSRIAQKSDLSDPQVIADFARHVGDERHLTALYLLTVADIRGTSPKVWNAWKGKLLEDLFRYTLRALRNGKDGPVQAPHAEIEAHKHQALAQFHAAESQAPALAHEALWKTLDVSYFMRHDADDIAWHTQQLWQHVGSGKTLVRARPSPAGEGLQVLVYTPDAPDLFARICGYFDQSEFSILDARVHTARNGYALDTFQIVAPGTQQATRDAEPPRAILAQVENELSRTITEAAPLPAPSKGRLSRRVKHFPVMPRVSLKPDDKAQRWLLSITASDQTGLLYKIARVLARHRINLQLAKVNTLGERVDDTFLIDGPELQNNRAQIEIETELLDVLAS
ncbi:[protein-PII] uridylyltransferase [Hylemonella gracilis]|uniref:Bifunctional uridylyltransferase/uridylyl-removing enzyme n=1 Tax=Hylemonella gracilis ATCC 19624 TaxID=887062 RepID=F3KR72_9BURK|nr:[protein-PII] uridylyltransferase [Hylemonella gracilis]EGI77773.1 PII uridylyl-transferase [Hylemonella gracilis ATCC 19624]